MENALLQFFRSHWLFSAQNETYVTIETTPTMTNVLDRTIKKHLRVSTTMRQKFVVFLFRMKSEYFEQLVKQTVRFRSKTHPNSIHPNSLLNKPKRKRLSTQHNP
jgi:hypothetical protein